MLTAPNSVVTDAAGDLFIADTADQRVREVNASTGVITTVAGNGGAGFSGDGGQASSASLYYPAGLALDTSGHLFIADTENNRIREVNLSTGIIATVVGNGTYGYSGDGGQATGAELRYPGGVAVDMYGDLFIADTSNNCIREVNLTTGIINTVAGNGISGYGGDGGRASNAELSLPKSVAVDGSGNLFIADSANNRIRQVNLATGIISTAAGNGTSGYSGDSGQATSAELADPLGVTVDGSGHVFIADTANSRIREVSLSTGIISTVVGSGTRGSSGDGGQPRSPGSLRLQVRR